MSAAAADRSRSLGSVSEGVSWANATVADQPWLPLGSVLELTNYPTLRQILATQQVVQVMTGDATADLGELSLLGRSGHGAMLLAPLVSAGEVAGVLVALSAVERPWTRTETSRAVSAPMPEAAPVTIVRLPS